jgi:hypothetical protein
MKRFVLLSLAGLICLGLNLFMSEPVSARPEYKARLEEVTKASKAADAIKEQKCNVCHYGTTKKNRNDFGKALNKSIDATAYKALKDEDNKEKLTEKIDAALKAAMKEKSADGKTFGSLIEAGQLPAKNPQE